MRGENTRAPVICPNYKRKNQDAMKNLFHLKKDFISFKKDLIHFKGLWERTDKRVPLFGASLRMIFIVFKWYIILAIPIVIGVLIYDGVTHQFFEKESETSYNPWIDGVDVPKNRTFKSVQVTGSPTEEDGIFWQITNITESKTIESEALMPSLHQKTQLTEGKFVKIILTIKNQFIKMKTINIQTIQLVDHKNRHFPLIGNQKIYPRPSHDYKKITLKPDIPVKLKLLFEVAEDSEDYLLNFDFMY